MAITTASPRSGERPRRATTSSFRSTWIFGGTIDPALTVKRDRAVSRSVGVCNDMRKGKDDTTVAKNAAYRCDGGTGSVDKAKGALIAEAIKTTYYKS
ncbi:hypothetical protein ACIRFH_24575 [Streptomyces sp. NPDC093586]|uniref:hypothetical protein n=1 Tax=Streptomyces sp. NPDC093586 TaxID=3366042 RepID=UPI00380F209B